MNSSKKKQHPPLHQFAYTDLLFKKSKSCWQELEDMLESSGKSLEEWISLARSYNGVEKDFYLAHLEVIQRHLSFYKKYKLPSSSVNTTLKRSSFFKHRV